MLQANLKKYESGTLLENKIKFSSNWNIHKLDCKFFTTIRKPDLFNYYEPRIGEIFDVELNKKPFCKALLRDATLTSIEKITPELMVLDTGTTDYKNLFEKFHIIDKCVLLLFEKVEL